MTLCVVQLWSNCLTSSRTAIKNSCFPRTKITS